MATKTSKKKTTRPAKPTHAVCLSCPGAKSMVMHKIKDMHKNENGRLVCAECYAPPPKAKAKKEAPDKWYVVQVNPGSETQVRADIMKQVRVRNLEGMVKRVMSPSCLVERVGPRTGDVLAEGSFTYPASMRQGDAYRQARAAATEAARAIHLKRNPDLEEVDVVGETHFENLRVTCFPGKTPGTLDWKVREVFPDESVRRVVKGRKFPGYMLVNMEWNVETERLVRKTRNVWSILLDPVVTGHLIKLSERSSKFAVKGQNLGWNWRVCEPDGGKCVAKGWAPSKMEARTAAEKAKADAEAFHPTALDNQEAAEALIAQQAVNQILKDKEELNKAVVNIRVGDRVRVKAGVFRGHRAEVVRVVRNPKDKADVKVEIKMQILGTDVVQTVQHFECERTTPGDRDD